MADEDQTNAAYEAIGHFYCAFSELDYELGEALKVIFRMQNHEAADAIVALADFVKKIHLIMSAAEFAQRPTGKDLPVAWKQAAEKTLKNVLKVNDEDRVPLAHSRLQPQADGSVLVTRLTARGSLKIQNDRWTQEHFRRKCEQLDRLTADMREIRKELSTIYLSARASAVSSARGVLDASQG
jgi:hypothetical protein